VSGFGGGLYNSGTATLTNTIIAGNTAASGPDVFTSAPVTSLGYNLIGATDGSSGWIASDLMGTNVQPLDPVLGPLANYGGPTQTMILLPGSPAIDAGISGTGIPTTDQRGVSRVNGVDIGAYEVPQLSQDITFSPLAAVTYGDADFQISATATSDLAVSFSASGNASVYQEAGVWYVHILAAGSATITASQVGNYGFAAAPDVSQGLTITPAPLTISANNQTMTYGGTLPTLTASYNGLVNGNTPSAITGLVLATVPANSNAGSYAIDASGASNPNYDITFANGTLTIMPAALTVTVNNQSRLYGQPNGTFTGTVAGVVPGDGITATYSTSATQFSAPGLYPITAVLNDPNGKLGNYSVTIDPGTLAVLSTTKISVTSSSINSVFGEAVTFTATVVPSEQGQAAPSGWVTLEDAGVPLATVSLAANDQANYTTSALAAGTDAIKAVYDGDATYEISTSAVLKQVVAKDATSTAVVSSANPSVAGQSVTFTIAVTANAPGSGIPTGTVSFRDSGVVLASIPLDGTGHASYTTSSLAVRNHNIVAVYTGSSNFVASTSTTLVQTVTKDATAATLVSSQNPIASGKPVTFTVAVSAVAPGTGTPTGNVNFYDGATLIGTETLNGSGVASLTVSNLPVGSDRISAAYAGDSKFKTIRTAVLVEQVENAPAAELLAALKLAPWDTKHVDQLFS
jgi:hypothetical protein